MAESALTILILTIIVLVVAILFKGVARLVAFGVIAVLAVTTLPSIREEIGNFVNPDSAVQQNYGINNNQTDNPTTSSNNGVGNANSNTGSNASGDRVVQPFDRPSAPAPTTSPRAVPASPNVPQNDDTVPAFW